MRLYIHISMSRELKSCVRKYRILDLFLVAGSTSLRLSVGSFEVSEVRHPHPRILLTCSEIRWRRMKYRPPLNPNEVAAERKTAIRKAKYEPKRANIQISEMRGGGSKMGGHQHQRGGRRASILGRRQREIRCPSMRENRPICERKPESISPGGIKEMVRTEAPRSGVAMNEETRKARFAMRNEPQELS